MLVPFLKTTYTSAYMRSIIKHAFLYSIFCWIAFGFCSCSSEGQAIKNQSATEKIRLNQVGFYPHAPKIAVLAEGEAEQFFITTPDLQDTLYTGNLSESLSSSYTDKKTQIADFSDFTSTGTFVVSIPEVGSSYPFEVKADVLQPVAKGSIKAFYYIRASTPIEEQYAGQWKRAAGHPDNQVEIHPSAATASRPAGTIISSSRGWYDAGDYNKYIVNSGITTATLLSLYEDFPAYFDTLKLNIPESSNEVPDLLDEILWNLRWMLTMQDPEDGGVYHKLTTSSFEGMIMPEDARKQRYVIQKSTAATLDFAAVMAQAARILKSFETELPGLADSCLNASRLAWNWSRQHPEVLYDQGAMNEKYDPDVTTGAYGDRDVSDEWIWAASELYVTTKADSFYTAVNLFPDQEMPIPTWNQVRLLGYYTLARHQDQLTEVAQKDMPQLKKQIIGLADALMEDVEQHPYHTVMGKSERDYNWGSSSNAANQGIALIHAYQLSIDAKYLQYALHNMDYLLGRNATGYSFVTGYGDKTPMHPHHRPSVADDVDEPVPGLLSGGPNARAPQQDKCDTYTSTDPDATFTDDDCSYASNEIAINWNAPLAYLVAAIEALQDKVEFSVKE